MKKHAFRKFVDFINYVQLSSSDLDVYKLLLEKPMTMEQLKSTSGLSERTLRTNIDDLIERNFIKRKVIEGKRIKYIYYATPQESLFYDMMTAFKKLEKRRLRMRKEILKGSE